jgi:hypothetical protein
MFAGASCNLASGDNTDGGGSCAMRMVSSVVSGRVAWNHSVFGAAAGRWAGLSSDRSATTVLVSPAQAEMKLDWFEQAAFRNRGPLKPNGA